MKAIVDSRAGHDKRTADTHTFSVKPAHTIKFEGRQGRVEHSDDQARQGTRRQEEGSQRRRITITFTDDNTFSV
jgi:hypothetical protein